MATYVDEIITTTFQLKDGTQVKSKCELYDMKLLPGSLCMASAEDMKTMFRSLNSGQELISAIDARYYGMYKDSLAEDANFDRVSQIQFDDVRTVTVKVDYDDEYGNGVRKFKYTTATKQCTMKDKSSAKAAETYRGNNENAESILVMYSDMGMSPEEIAGYLGLSVDEVQSVIDETDLNI